MLGLYDFLDIRDRGPPAKLKLGESMQELGRIYWTRQGLRLAHSALMVWLAVSVMTALMPKGTSVTGTAPSSAAEVLRGMVDGAVMAVALPGGAMVVLGIVGAVLNRRDVRRRDPVRRFTRQQRREGMARAGGQCEMERRLGRRCSRPAEHGDHFYPWSKGGSTSLQNFVAACAKCNRAKRARIPSPGQQQRLERRRRDYVPPSSSVSAGERQSLPLGRFSADASAQR
ncbi:HNH endonuclease signature motif containing protein [Arthrobacter sp. Cr_A7]|uniref:HNH endonuclease n=1 Tax=Arthrobacter sp. Cr_A7 TaxID=3031017 RepID=UPI0023DC48DC|nr:HNH endonuclease signature motif containing protein [Arthrobacter sp. Cr_A7]MDF2051135.1 HNH endonuclease signature motif containing protein [Arthrobacter sp. Cr_A7]